jgi:hippurate hydrolase
MQLTVRSYKPEVRSQVLDSIRTIAMHTALASGTPTELLPVVTIDENEFTPSTYNNPVLTERLRRVFARELGEDRVVTAEPVMAGEDFSRYSLKSLEIPSVIFWLGTVDAKKLTAAQAAGNQLPPLHSSAFAPSLRPTLENGVRAMTAATLELLRGNE